MLSVSDGFNTSVSGTGRPSLLRVGIKSAALVEAVMHHVLRLLIVFYVLSLALRLNAALLLLVLLCSAIVGKLMQDAHSLNPSFTLTRRASVEHRPKHTHTDSIIAALPSLGRCGAANSGYKDLG